MVFARNDGNLTRMEVLLGIGEMQGVLKVLVNDVEIPAGVDGHQHDGNRLVQHSDAGHAIRRVQLRISLDGSGQPAGDPYGSMAYLSVVVPNRINNGTSLPKVTVLVQGLKLPVYAADGSYQRRAVFEQSGVDSAGHPAAGGLEPGGDRCGELRGGGGVLR